MFLLVPVNPSVNDDKEQTQRTQQVTNDDLPDTKSGIRNQKNNSPLFIL